MESTNNLSNTATYVEQKEISLLDLLVTLAENAKLLIIGSLLAGLSALGIGYLLPQTFESVAVLQAEQATASLMTTAAVLDPVVIKLGLAKGESAEQARLNLRQNIKTAVGRNDKLLTLTVSAPTSQLAQATAVALLDQTYLQNRPHGSLRLRLEAQLADAKASLKNAGTAAAAIAKRIETPAATPTGETNLTSGYAELLKAAVAIQTQISELETLLNGVSAAQLVQAPTLPEKASQPKKALIAIGTTLAAGLVLMLFIFIRQALRSTANDAEATAKLVRIRQALGLK
jgi:LPS O-antigen subunit length determinant protein (WzzB/FepE family)